MKNIYHILPLLCLSIAFLILNISAEYKDDEFYCKRNSSDFQICHRCLNPEVEGGCPKNPEDENKCGCNNLAVYDGYRDKAYRGGGNCQTEDDYGEFYCYVDHSANCGDMEQSYFAGSKLHLWYEKDRDQHPKVYWSVWACNDTVADDDRQPITGSELVSGSEQFLPGVKITSDRLKSESGGIVEFTFSDDDIGYGWEKCQAQCVTRNTKEGICGAWSYDALNLKCYLHNVDACCGQKEKQERVDVEEFISGYVCPHCWSTYNECPCGLEWRQACLNCEILGNVLALADSTTLVETTSDQVIPNTVSSVSTDDVYTSTWTIFPCAPKPVFQTKLNKWTYKKPCCKKSGCTNDSKCQKTC